MSGMRKSLAHAAVLKVVCTCNIDHKARTHGLDHERFTLSQLECAWSQMHQLRCALTLAWLSHDLVCADNAD